MKRTLFLLFIIFLTQFAVSLKANAENMVVNKGSVTIYVGEEKTLYHTVPYQYYVNPNSSWFIRQRLGSGWSDGQSDYSTKIVSKDYSSCTIKGLADNESSYNDGTGYKCELHCKGTKNSTGEYYECYWTIIVKSRGNIYVDANPSFGYWNNPTMVQAGSKIYLSARTSNGSSASDAKIYYTTDGSDANENSTLYTSAGITINKKTYISAIASKNGYSPVGCGGYFDVYEDIKVTSITLNNSSLSLQVGQSETLTATVKPDNAANKTVTWSSNPTGIVTVSNGKVTANAPGNAKITCKANDGSGVQATCDVTVVPAVNIDINATNFPDENFRNYLLAQDYGQDGILTVSEISNVTKMEVTHKNIKSLKGIEFFTALTDLNCRCNFMDSLDTSKNTALRVLDCAMYDLKYLNVSGNAVLEGLSCNNNKLESLDVTKNASLIWLDCWDNKLTSLDVSKNASLKSLRCMSNKLTSLDLSKNTSIEEIRCEGNDIRGTAMDNLISSLPQNVTGNRYEFCVVDPGFSYDGNICTKAQVAAVKAKGWFPCYYGYNNGVLGYWEYEGNDDIVMVTNISLNKSSLSLLTGQSETLTATVKPDNATDKTVAWTSSNTNIASVDSNGKVTAKAKGSATITCKANDGSGKQATCYVTVTDPIIEPTAITISPSSKTITVGEEFYASYTLTPSNATTTVTWYSDDTSIATVTQEGLVKGIKAGYTWINVKTANGKTDYFKVTVTEPDPSPKVRIISVICDKTDISQNESLVMHATLKNLDETREISTRLMLCDDEMNILYYGPSDRREYKTGENVTVDFNYPLDTIPVGDYKATVMHYSKWHDDGKWYWTYDQTKTVDIHVIASTLKGDVNEDGSVNGTDLVALTNIILGKNPEKPSADVNGDGYVNGTDYVALANIILGKSNARRMTDIGEGHTTGNSVLYLEPFAISAGETKELSIGLTNPDDALTLLQFDLQLPKGLSLAKAGDDYLADMSGRTNRSSHQLSVYGNDHHARFLLASGCNDLIEGTEGVVIRLTVTADADFNGGVIALHDILGVSPDEQEVNMADCQFSLAGDATGIYSINGNQDTTEIYSLSGQRQSAMKKGINIVGGKKVIKK